MAQFYRGRARTCALQAVARHVNTLDTGRSKCVVNYQIHSREVFTFLFTASLKRFLKS